MARTRRLAAATSLALTLALATAATAQTPPPCGPGGAFPDVPQSHPFCDWIRQLTQDQIAATCDGTNYCPDAPVTRAQLALFLYRLSRGTATSQVDADTLDGIDSSGFGDITAVTTIVGSGLAGGAASGAVSLSIPTGGVNSDRIENGTILFEDLAANGCASNTFIKRSGSVWTCGTSAAPIAFVHTISDTAEGGFPNYAGTTTFLNHASLNNNGNAIIVASPRNVSGGAIWVDFFDLGGSLGSRWRLHRHDGVDFVAGQTYNVIAVLP